ncbi:MAG: PIN domain-containing protein [Ignavibacteria bacterium]|nr:PIN domain-containing protein [Ignavibacteria bacterium]
MHEGVLLDTSFFLRFLNEKDDLFEKADKYYRYFIQKEFSLFISTISIAEFCVLGTADALPLKNLLIVPFNINHAKKAGELARFLYESRKANQLEVNERPIIINDAKLFAQAQEEVNIKFFVTSDKRSFKMYELLKVKCNLNFEFIDIKIDHTETFGLLNL